MVTKKNDISVMQKMAVRIVESPTEFFREMPKTDGFFEPLVFTVVAGFAASIIHAIWSFLGFGYGGEAQPGWAWILLSIIISPFVFAIGSFIGAAVMFLIWKLVGSQQNYETSYRSIAYLMSIAPLIAIIEIIPYAGIVLTIAIVTFYVIVVSREVHGIPLRKALLVFGIIGLIITMLSLYSEYSKRNPTPEQVRKAAEETARQYQQNIDELRQQAKRDR
jgi:hypothetical protein